jgi:hypothetical protein
MVHTLGQKQQGKAVRLFCVETNPSVDAKHTVLKTELNSEIYLGV